MRVHEVNLVENEQLRDLVKPDLFQQPVNGFHLLLEPGVADVHDMENKVRILHLVKGSPECAKQILRQILDEPDRVGDHDLTVPGKTQPARGGIQRCEQQVLRLDAVTGSAC